MVTDYWHESAKIGVPHFLFCTTDGKIAILMRTLTLAMTLLRLMKNGEFWSSNPCILQACLLHAGRCHAFCS